MQKRRCFAGSGIPHVASIRLELLMFRAWRDRRRRDATQESITDTTPLARTRRDTAVDDEGCAITGETRRRVVNDLHAQMEACIFFGQTGHPIHGTWISYVKSTVDFCPYATRADSTISVTENDLSLGTVNYSGRTRAHLHHGILPPIISGQPGNWALTTASPNVPLEPPNQACGINILGGILRVTHFGTRQTVQRFGCRKLEHSKILRRGGRRGNLSLPRRS